MKNICYPMGGVEYSTTERVVGKWIDGKPLYQKTISCGTLPNNTTGYIPVGLSANVINIKSITGVAIKSNVTITIPRSYTDPVFNIDVVYNPDNARLAITTNRDYSEFPESYVTLRYTKTTD